MREAGHLNYLTREYLKTIVKPGITTKEIDDLCGKYIESIGGIPGFKGYGGFPGNICISVNEEVVHGIPSDRVLKEGDIVSLDVGVMAHGYHSDACITIPVGKISHEKEMLLKHTEDALYAGIKEVKDGYAKNFLIKNGYAEQLTEDSYSKFQKGQEEERLQEEYLENRGFKYSLIAGISCSRGNNLFTFIILLLISLFGACKDIAKLICNPSLAYLTILSASPEVETVICLAPICSPQTQFIILMKSKTLS